MEIKKTNYLCNILLAIFPLSIIIGPSISLINTIILGLVATIYIYYEKKNFLLDKKIIYLLLFFYLYLIFNNFISLDKEIGLLRNLGFVRFIVLFVGINFIFFKYKNNENIFLIWFIILFFTTADVYIEVFTGTNVLGFGADRINGVSQPDGDRVMSFFKDRAVVGSFILSFSFLVFGYLLDKYSTKNQIWKLLTFIIPILFLTAVLLTGERSNAIKFLIAFLIFFILVGHLKNKFKIYVIIFSLIIITISVSKSEFLKMRYGGQLFSNFIDDKSRENFFQNNTYIKIYKSGLKVFKQYPVFGVGNKNYRVEACLSENAKKNKLNDDGTIDFYYQCNTHPHQIYIEFLSEHGVIGTTVLLTILFFLIFNKFKLIIISKNALQLGCLVYLIVIFMPILPSGSFFTDFNSILFWLNVSIMYAVNDKTNIFKNKLDK